VGTLKRKQSMEKKNSATMLEEARKREDSLYDDATELEVCFVILIGCSFTCPVAIKSHCPGFPIPT
jgi:hypothetical protein